jgi:tetraacyldisaccharide 4'-kinase
VKRALGSLFALAAAARVGAYRRGLLRQHRLSGPVVSVGNLGLGGSGKTPVVRRVAELLRAEGLGVSILSRGYGGSFRGAALIVSDGAEVTAPARLAGDEPVMLARALPGVVVAVGRRRHEAGRAVEQRFGPMVHVLDDGFQHLALARDLDLLCLDVKDLADRPLPAGRLREAASAVERADVVLLTRIDVASEVELVDLEGRLGPERTFRVDRRLCGFRALGGGRVAAPGRAFLLAAIARPERLARDVAAAQATIVGRAFFRDHHRFRAPELGAVAARAAAAGASAIVTTAKDAVRLEALPRPALPIVVAESEAVIDDEPRFVRRLLAVARRTP